MMGDGNASPDSSGDRPTAGIMFCPERVATSAEWAKRNEAPQAVLASVE